MSEKVWKKGNPLMPLVGMKTDADTVKNSIKFPPKNKTQRYHVIQKPHSLAYIWTKYNSKRYMQAYVHSSTIYNSQNIEWFKSGKEVCQACILSLCLLNLFAEYILWNVGLDDSQTGIKIARRNINNLRYADDITLIAECKEELKSLLMRVKEESEKADLKLSIHNIKIMASGPITSWQIDGETVRDFYFLGLQNHSRWWLQPWN